MKTKITALFIALTLLFSITAGASFSDVDTGTNIGNAVMQLSRLNILNGYKDGTFRPYDTLTRGQFAKIAVCMLGKTEEASAVKENAVFSDVSTQHWANGYINYIAGCGIINGYPDGSFGAEETITYAQAITILVRLLGYDGEDVSYKWPEGYISKAESLGITKGLSFGVYDNVTRGNAAYLIYNTLLSEKKENSQIQLISSSSAEGVVIYADWEIDASLSNGSISTTKGVYKLADNTNISEDVYGSLGTLYLNGEGKATAFVPENETVRSVTLVSAVQNSSGKVEVSFTEGNTTRSETYGSGAPLFCDGKSTTMSEGISYIEPGREALLFYAENGSFERMYISESSMIGPVTIQGGYSHVYQSFNIVNSNTLSVIRNGDTANIEDISAYDVAYYMPGNNTLYVYTEKKSGTYEEAYPIKASVTSVVVGGKEYTLSTQTAIKKMNTSDSAFELGDRVTLLFGRNGDVVDVVDLATGGSLNTAVLAKSYSEISKEDLTEGKTINYATLVLRDGGEVTYETDKDYSDYIGKVVRVNYEDGIAKLSYIVPSPIYGEFDADTPSLDGHWLASDCTILELAETTSQGAVVKRIDVRDISATSLTKSQVIHAETTGSLKDISFLYVQNITKSNADFGVVTQANDGNNYTILCGSEKVSVKTAAKLSRGCAVELVESQTGGTTAKSLIKIATEADIEGFSSGRIRLNGVNYVVSDYVKIYGGRSAEEFKSMSVSELMETDDINLITLYSDRTLSSGGIIRVIVVSTN